MNYSDLLTLVRADPEAHKDAPGLVSKRFLLVNQDKRIAYDQFLSLLETNDLRSHFVRKVMYFVWAYRDERIRRFICERVADSTGKWRVAQLLRKENSEFFEQWMQPNTAKKARSNFEFYLIESAIFDPKTKTVRLGLEDGWLQQAAIVAAQHEHDPIIRTELLANPVEFLRARDWLGLLNARYQELPSISATLSIDTPPLEDQGIEVSPSISVAQSRDWDRKGPESSGRKTTTTAIDLVARERANKSHYMLERMLADLSKKVGFSPKYTQNIDLYFDTPHGSVLAEIKSCTDGNFHSQFRKGVSQLFEYRYVYKDLLSKNAVMLLVMESRPPRNKTWLIDYAASIGVTLAWKDIDSAGIVAKAIHPAMAKVISKA